MSGYIDKVVDLQEVHRLHTKALEGGLHLRDTLVAALGPDLGGDEQALAQLELRDQVAGDAFRGSVHRGRVNDVAVEQLQHFTQRRACRGIAADIEGLPGSKADFRKVHLLLRESIAGTEAKARGEKHSSARVHESILAV